MEFTEDTASRGESEEIARRSWLMCKGNVRQALRRVLRNTELPPSSGEAWTEELAPGLGEETAGREPQVSTLRLEEAEDEGAGTRGQG